MMGIAAGASDFLTKPIDLQELTLRVGHAVHAKRLFDQLQAEQEKSEHLLLNTLPRRIAERMKQGEVNIVDQHPDVTLLVADLTYERLKDKYRFDGSQTIEIKGRGAELVHALLGRL